MRYIHINPLRARLVKDVKALDRYCFAGHSCLMGKRVNAWQEMDAVLALFGERVSLARRRYRAYLKKGIDQGQRPELVGGGLVRSAGGWSVVREMRKAGTFLKGDERILGGSEFVRNVLTEAQEKLERRYAPAARGVGIDQLMTAVADLMALEPADLVGPSKIRSIVKARILVCYWAARELGLSMTEIAATLEISVPTVSIAVKKGRKMVREEGLNLADLLNIKI